MGKDISVSEIFDAYENWCQVGLKHTLFGYMLSVVVVSVTLELFYLAAFENPQAELNGVENGEWGCQ
jgi:hypothetical protein